MNPEIKERWITALRSDEYRQTTNYLNRNGGYCCLGVLCEIAVEDGVVTKSFYDPDETIVMYSDPNDGYDKTTKVLPDAVAQWAGFGLTDNPEVEIFVDLHDSSGERLRKISLAELNDRAGFNFHQIADVIEEKF